MLNLACQMPYDKAELHEKFPDLDMGGELDYFLRFFPHFQANR